VSFGALTIIANTHAKLQGHKYRFMRTSAFVATGMSVVAPLIHGSRIFGLDLMNKKAFTYTLVAKMGCLLSGTALYSVSLPFSHTGENLILIVRDLKVEVPRKPMAWKVRHVQFTLIHAHPSGLRLCYPADGVSGSLRLCLLENYLLGFLSH